MDTNLLGQILVTALTIVIVVGYGIMVWFNHRSVRKGGKT